MTTQPEQQPGGFDAAVTAAEAKSTKVDIENQLASSPDHASRNSHDGPDADYGVQCPARISERDLLTRIDLHVIPFLSIMYLMAFLDRTNIGNAVIFDLKKDLGLTGDQFNTALTILFVPYILFEIPSNILLKRLKPHVWLSACTFIFGIVTVGQGLVQNYAGLLVTRFLLGLAEAGMFPGCFYLIGMWYRRHEAQRRYTFFFSSTTLAGAFGGLLASAIGKMHGMRGYSGWRWIFIIEGVLTCLLAVGLFWLLPGFPENAQWLREDERAFVRARLHSEQGRNAHDHAFTPRGVARVFRDPRVFVGGLMYLGLIVPAYSYAFFAPTVIQSFDGLDSIQTQLHSVPPWAAAFVFAMLAAYASDKLRHRFAFAVLACCISIAGFAMLTTIHDNVQAQYGALFLATMGAYTAMPIIVCWFNMNLGGHTRRAVGSAWQIGFGNIGGIIATYAFLDSDKPYYRTGFAICLGFISLSCAACVVYVSWCWWENHRRDVRGAALEKEGLTDKEREELGDLHWRYRYLL